jgi:DNA-binding transcriptional regulator LsrR (DeoR family)
MTLTGGDIVGMSSWSATLLAAVDAMRPLSRAGAKRVVQLMGGVGNPSAEAHAARLTQRFAELTGAQPTFLLAPGIASSAEAHDVLLKEPVVRDAMSAIDDVTLALVGIGSLEPSHAAAEQRQHLPRQGTPPARQARRGRRHLPPAHRCRGQADAVGRRQARDRRDPGSARRTDRSVGVAGGPRKYEAIRAALLGRWVNVLITDQVTAERLITDSPTVPPPVAGDVSRSTS